MRSNNSPRPSLSKREGAIFLFNTIYGSVAIVWFKRHGSVKIKEIVISNPELSAEQRVAVKYPDASLKSCGKVSQLAENIIKYCDGKNVEFKLDMLDFDGIPEFRKKVYRTLFKTKRGETISYGELASRSGYYQAARAVGTAMKNNPFPFIIPCHRVIRSDGSLGGFFGAEEMKKKLIEKEKVKAKSV